MVEEEVGGGGLSVEMRMRPVGLCCEGCGGDGGCSGGVEQEADAVLSGWVKVVASDLSWVMMTSRSQVKLK